MTATPNSVFMSWAVISGGLLAVVLVVALVAALFSGRIWAVVAGVFGTLLLIVGGLLLVGLLLFRVRHAQVDIDRIQATPKPMRIETTPRFVEQTSPPGSAPSSPSTNPIAESTGGPTETTEAPSGPSRPAWMDGPMGRVGNVYRTTVKVGPAFSRTECEQQLADALRLAVRTYTDHFIGEGKGQYVDLPMSYIRNHLVRDEWVEHRQTTFETMSTLHALLEFDGQANEAIEANYKESVVVGRLCYTATGGGAILGLLTILYGYLKLDTLTRGYYTARLRLSAVAAILALAAIAGLLGMP